MDEEEEGMMIANSKLDALIDDILTGIRDAGLDPTELLVEQDNEPFPDELMAMIERSSRVCADDCSITDALMSDVNFQRLKRNPILHRHLLLQGVLVLLGERLEARRR
ncbi:hypothetical protein [Mesorhizobium sp. M0088]|uniref:hypothetical protein n=1 Tax=Mesorhizobium sp. M0088 TaxID=2956873 RepID=UPI00333D1821